jgi:hypothetical protein
MLEVLHILPMSYSSCDKRVTDDYSAGKAPSLFSTQGYHRIHPRGSPRWQHRGNESNGSQHRCRCSQNERAPCFDAEKFGCHHMTCAYGRRQADEQAKTNLQKRGAQHHLSNIGAISSERHANADFAAALREKVGKNSVESNHDKQSGEHAEEPG